MHKLTSVFGPAATVWPLMFRTKEAADAAWVAACAKDSDYLSITDDFSQTVHIKMESLHGVMYEELEVSRLAHIEHQLYVWRVQATAQQNAAVDPALRAAAAARGPAVITPQGGMNGMGRF